MTTIDYRNPDLWAERTPDEIWTAYRHGRDQLLNELFRPGRHASAFSIRDPRIPESTESRTGI